MAVQAFDQKFGIDGHAKSLVQFRKAHEENSNALVNLMEGKQADAIRPAYDPTHPDNKWPLMVHHAVKGELAVGQSIKGIQEAGLRKQMIQSNETQLAAALKSGYQLAPFPKVQIAMLSPEAEKAQLKKQNEDLQGQILMQQQAHDRLQAQVDSLLNAGK